MEIFNYMNNRNVICIVGPTAVGKTRLSIELANAYDGEIINADSTQVYRGLDIATAKVTKEEMGAIPHHLLDIYNITDEYNVCEYQTDGRRVLEDIMTRGKIPIVVGGTGLYIKALLYDYRFEDSYNDETFAGVEDEELYRRLKALDPNTDIDAHNRKRVVKALNYCIKMGKPYSAKEKTDRLLYNADIIGLTTDREILYQRINDRVDIMLRQGLIEEAKGIYDKGIRTRSVMTPIGYKELFAYFDGEISYDDAVELIKKRSRNYAKRQYTWFNNQMQVKWFDTCFEDFRVTVECVKKYLETEWHDSYAK